MGSFNKRVTRTRYIYSVITQPPCHPTTLGHPGLPKPGALLCRAVAGRGACLLPLGAHGHPQELHHQVQGDTAQGPPPPVAGLSPLPAPHTVVTSTALLSHMPGSNPPLPSDIQSNLNFKAGSYLELHLYS